MADIELTRSHTLDKAEAREAVDRVADELQQSLSFERAWRGDVLRFKGSGASGRIEVSADAVRVAADLGLLLRPLRPIVRREARRLLDTHLH